jgi:predicted acylesterase/phospholipase RssA
MEQTAKPLIAAKVPASPLEKIALSLSGGGYRAATFHLGGMSYLNRLSYKNVPLLEKVEMISTVSGGTIPGVVYTLMLQKGQSFEQCYHFLLAKLEETDLVSTGIQKLNPKENLINPGKAKNLINAFAEQYEKDFTAGAVLGDLKGMKGHLKNVVFNATEFTNAINFRFRNPDSRLKSGNDSFKLANGISSEIKLSDIIASSSCFPGGFEPLRWPDDYVHAASPGLTTLCQYNKAHKIQPTGIMDGGIYDNQGIESILMYKSGFEKPYFDLIIVSDVASPEMSAYVPFGEEPKDSGWKTLTPAILSAQIQACSVKLNNILFALTGLFVLLPLCWGYNNNIATGGCMLAAVISLLLFFLKRRLEKFAGLKFSMLKAWVFEKIPSFYFQQLSRLKVQDLSFHRIEPLLYNRVNSILTLLTDVFLKVIRRLNYRRLYENNNYALRRSTTLIKELTQKDWTQKHPKGNYALEIGANIQQVVEKAAGFGTTLWFTDQEKLDNMLRLLVITGQLTMCYNLKMYLQELTEPAKDPKKDNGFSSLPAAVQEQLLLTLDSCKLDWENFKANPSFLFDLLNLHKRAIVVKPGNKMAAKRGRK